jgi:hypothetical protein
MNTQILWNPERGRCDECGRKSDHTRLFTSAESKTCFCKGCWEKYIEECNVPSGQWKRSVRNDWSSDVALELVFDEDADGTAQGVGHWN